MEEAGRRGEPAGPMPLEEAPATNGDGPHKRRMNVQELIRHALILCGARSPHCTAPRENMARQLLEELPKTGQGSDADGGSKLNKVCWKDGGTGARVRLGASSYKKTSARRNWLRR